MGFLTLPRYDHEVPMPSTKITRFRWAPRRRERPPLSAVLLFTVMLPLAVLIFAVRMQLAARIPADRSLPDAPAFELARPQPHQSEQPPTAPAAPAAVPAPAADAAFPALPPRLDAMYPPSALLPNETHLRAIPFTSPHVLTAYARPALAHAHPALDVFIFTSALTVRNLSATFCALRGRLFALDSQANDVVVCQVPRAVLSVLNARASQPNGPGGSRDAAATAAAAADGDVRTRLSGVSVVVRLPHLSPADLPLSYVVKQGVRAGDLLPLPPPFAPRLYALRSYVRRVPLDTGARAPAAAARWQPRWAVCHGLIVAPGAQATRDWVDHHRRLGVDRVFVFDNGARQAANVRLDALFSGRRDVEIISWPWRHSQLQAYALLLVAARARCGHVFLSDLDEWLMPGLGRAPFHAGRRPLHAELARVRARGFDNVQFRTIGMMNPGYVRTPRGRWPELFLRLRRRQNLSEGKSICTGDPDWRGARVHPCGVLPNGTSPERFLEPLENFENRPDRGLFPRDETDAPLLVHFYARSWQEWVEKLELGGMSLLGTKIAAPMRGRLSVERPDWEAVTAYRERSLTYTHFRDVWRRVRNEAADRVNEAVVVRELPNGTLSRVVVMLES